MTTALEDAENNPNSQLSQADKRVEELNRELQLDLAQAALLNLDSLPYTF